MYVWKCMYVFLFYLITEILLKQFQQRTSNLILIDHSIHTKRAIPFSLALRLRRICSPNETFTLRTNELIDYLHKRGYN